MANADIFKPNFDRLAVDGSIGDPQGRIACAYIRVSDSEQAEEGHAGLPRQISHIHEVASKHGFKIPWECVYVDDATGFEFEARPALTKLRALYKSGRVAAVVIEHLDRLSRQSEWHQGFLLEEMKKNGIEAVFWKPFASRVERAVMGAVAQDAMELTKERMKQGTVSKAQSGRITSKVRALGYVFVNSKGRVLESPGRDTYYAINDEAWIIRLIYEKAALGQTLRSLATLLQILCPEVRGKRGWHPTAVRYIIANPLYKGQYVANRWGHIKTPKYGQDGALIGYSEKMCERDPADWITVPVPAIVSQELWLRANAMLQINKERAKRNNRDRYILTGVLVCAECGRRWTGVSDPNFYYRCPGRYNVAKHLQNCTAPQISARILHTTIWRALCQILLEPELVIQALDDLASGEATQSLHAQMTFLEEAINSRKEEDERITKGFLAGVFDAAEAAQERKRIKIAIQNLENELAELRTRDLTPEQIEDEKALVLAAAASARDSDMFMDAPPEFQRNMLKLLVDRIIVDSHIQTLRIEGMIPLTLNYHALGGTIVSSPASCSG
jgi:site-specific DNA recombinase